MATSSSTLLFSLSLTFLFLLFLFNGCFGRQSVQQSPNECQLSQINAMEPTIRIEAEGGVTEFWDPHNDQFRCGGAHLFRHIIQPKGLLLPSYTNAPLIAYVLQGRGQFGIVVPGCRETYQSFQKSGKGGSSFLDRHQKIGTYKKGDIIVFPEGAAHWAFNSGKEDSILLVLQDTSNHANQLDANPLRFFLAGNAKQGGQDSGKHGGERLQERLGFSGNVLEGLDVQIVKDALNTDMETARKIVGEKSAEKSGHIITVERDLQLIVPSRSSEQSQPEQHQGSSSTNGLEETVCTASVRQNIDKPERADIYDPQAGRFTSVNRFTLPILGFVRLSAARGFLYKNWGIVPKWCVNAHSFIYVTKGSALVQIVNQRGETVLDDEVRKGQLFLVPQNFVAVKQAGEHGFEWVEFNTNDNAMFSTLSGRASTLAGLPADIIAASYQLSRSKAQSLKRNMVSAWFYKTSACSSSCEGQGDILLYKN